MPNQRLEDYLIHAKWPDDLSDYILGGPKHKFCVFCEHEHEYAIAFRLHPEKHEYVCMICPECKRAKEESLSNSFPDPKVLLHMEDNASTNKTIAQSSKDLNNYIYNQELPEIAVSFVSTGPNEDLCLFCEKHLTYGEDQFWPIEIPAGQSHKHYGGFAKVCHSCVNWITAYNVNLECHITHRDWCPVCKEEYAITGSEKMARRRDGSIKNHMCPSCFYNTGETWQSVINVQHNCEVCDIEFLTDKTCILANNLIKFAPHSYCHNCAKLSTDPGHEIIIKTPIKDYYIHISKDPGYKVSFLYYNILAPPSKRYPKAIRHSVSYGNYADLGKVAYAAMTDLHKLYKTREEYQTRLIL